MAIDPKDPTVTVGEAAANEYTHVRAECCHTTDVPFKMMRITKEDTLAQVTARMSCRHCGKPAKTTRFWRQQDALGYVIDPYASSRVKK